MLTRGYFARLEQFSSQLGVQGSEIMCMAFFTIRRNQVCVSLIVCLASLVGIAGCSSQATSTTQSKPDSRPYQEASQLSSFILLPGWTSGMFLHTDKESVAMPHESLTTRTFSFDFETQTAYIRDENSIIGFDLNGGSPQSVGTLASFDVHKLPDRDRRANLFGWDYNPNTSLVCCAFASGHDIWLYVLSDQGNKIEAQYSLHALSQKLGAEWRPNETVKAFSVAWHDDESVWVTIKSPRVQSEQLLEFFPDTIELDIYSGDVKHIGPGFPARTLSLPYDVLVQFHSRVDLGVSLTVMNTESIEDRMTVNFVGYVRNLVLAQDEILIATKEQCNDVVEIVGWRESLPRVFTGALGKKVEDAKPKTIGYGAGLRSVID